MQLKKKKRLQENRGRECSSLAGIPVGNWESSVLLPIIQTIRTTYDTINKYVYMQWISNSENVPFLQLQRTGFWIFYKLFCSICYVSQAINEIALERDANAEKLQQLIEENTNLSLLSKSNNHNFLDNQSVSSVDLNDLSSPGMALKWTFFFFFKINLRQSSLKRAKNLRPTVQ